MSINRDRLSRRHTRTLVKWWNTLNRWEWVDGFGADPGREDRVPRHERVRDLWMRAIERELALRVIFKKETSR